MFSQKHFYGRSHSKKDEMKICLYHQVRSWLVDTDQLHETKLEYVRKPKPITNVTKPVIKKHEYYRHEKVSKYDVSNH